MADNGGKSPKELSMEMRLLLAFLLMGAVLFLTPLIYSPQGPTPTDQPPKPAVQSRKPPAPEATPTVVPPKAAPGQLAGSKEETRVIETDLYRITFSTRGAIVKSWVLKKYKDGKGANLELVNQEAITKAGYPLAITYDGQAPPVDLNQALFVATTAPDGLGIDFRYSYARMTARKSLSFLKDSYLTQLTSEVMQDNRGIPHFISWRGGFGDHAIPGSASLQRAVYFEPSGTGGKLVANEAKAAKDGPITAAGSYTFAGIADAYFAAVVLPRGNTWYKVATYNDWVPSAPGGKDEMHVGTGIGGDIKNEFALFLGPKDIDLLRRVDPRLEQLIDFGWFGFVAKPLFLSLNWFNDKWIHNYGWSIVIVTMIINMLLMPLRITGFKSSRRMLALQPEVKAIQDRYKGIPARDPRKMQLQQEIMAVYSKHGVNPMSGCMPLLIQLPFFYAFYTVLTVAIEMRGASWLWVPDLSQPETIPIRILPLLMIVSQFVQTKMTPTPSADPAQQKMMLFMPIIFGGLFWGSPSGLVLYWVTGNVIGVVQQWFFNRMAGSVPTPAVVPARAQVAAPKKKASRK